MKLPAGMLTNCMRLTFSMLKYLRIRDSASASESRSGGSLHPTDCAVHDFARRRAPRLIGVAKSASHQLSQIEIASGNPCYQHPFHATLRSRLKALEFPEPTIIVFRCWCGLERSD